MTTTKAIQFEKTGAANVLKYVDTELGKPKKGEVLLRNTAIGLNFIDVYVRTGLYPNTGFPSGIGFEGAGVIEKVGAGVKDLKVGDRVCYGHSPLGAYAERRVQPAKDLIKIPAGIDDQTAAAIMLKGMTAQYLIRQIYKVGKGDTVLFHAAAGGVGLIACQWMKALGATVIGTVGSADKAKLAKKNGCTWVINSRKEDFVKRVDKITKGAGVNVVFDGVGKETLLGSLDCLKPRGTMVTFGNASGAPEPISPLLLAQKGSLMLTRPVLGHFISTREDLLKCARDVFKVVKSGDVKIQVNQTYALKGAAKAHRDLQGRKTTGSTILIP
jgi:NADPH:quinone reductase